MTTKTKCTHIEVNRILFYKHLDTLFKMDNLERWKLRIEHLSNCPIHRESLGSIHQMFLKLTEKYLQILLDRRIHVKVRAEFGIDLRVAVFENPNVDAIELLQYQNDFDVNARGYEQSTALHCSVRQNSLTYVRFLLDSGANVNAKDKWGSTALYECAIRSLDLNDFSCRYSSSGWNRKEIGQLLLERGADLELDEYFMLTLLDYRNTFLLAFIIAKFALIHVQGLPICQMIKDEILSPYKEIYEEYCRQLQRLKTCTIGGSSVTWFDLLTDKIDRLDHSSIYTQNTIALFAEYANRHELHSLYCSMMHHKVMNGLILYHFQSNLAQCIHNITGKSLNYNDLVIEKISNHLTFSDRNKFVSCRNNC